MQASSRVPRWSWTAGIWSVIALFEATQTVFGMRAEGMHHNWRALFITVFLSWLPWAMATPLVWQLADRYPFGKKISPSLLFHAVFALGVNAATAGWAALLTVLLNPYAVSPEPRPFAPVWLGKFYSGVLSSFILYGAILAVRHILESRERIARQETEAAKLNEQLSKTQLDALRKQIEPHFLFNALNSIAGLVREGKTEPATQMIALLSDFLRRVVNDSNRQLVSLSEELEFSQKYLDIQKVRFGDRLQLSINVPDELLSAQTPALLLQPMVENAIKHGISKRVDGGLVRISAERKNGMLVLQVYNDGPPTHSAESNSGVGMNNVRSRLQSLYGTAFRLEVENWQESGVEVSVSFPFQEQ